MNAPPPIEQVRGAVAFLQQPPLQQFIDAEDSFLTLHDLKTKAQAIVLAHAAESVAQADRRVAEEDREDRGMLSDLCGMCGAEIPEKSTYGFDLKEAVYMCSQCVADTPPIEPDARFVVTAAGVDALNEPTSAVDDEPDFEVLPDDGSERDERAA